jgi:hypothetical protein
MVHYWPRQSTFWSASANPELELNHRKQALKSKEAKAKVARRRHEDGAPIHSFPTLLADLATMVRNTCRLPHTEGEASTFPVLTIPSATPKRACEPIETYPM